MNDREIDYAVAEKVLGLKIIHYGTIGDFEFRQRDSANKVPTERIIYTGNVPRYTTDAAADYSVLVFVRENWPLPSPYRDEFQKQLYEIFGDRLSDDWPDSDLDKYLVGDYARAALACRASLAAIEK